MKTLIHSLFLILILSSFIRCEQNNIEDTVFETAIDERVNETIETYENQLISSTHGWIATYQSKSTFGAFNLHLKFLPNKMVEITSDYLNGNYDLPTSWRVSRLNKIELIFESYTVFHKLFEADFFVNEAEFEFQFNSISAEEIVLQSKSDADPKTILTLKKAQENSREQTVTLRGADALIEDHFKEATCFRIIETKNPSSAVVFNGSFSANINNRTASICSIGSIENDQILHQFVPNNKGFKFITPLVINNQNFEFFEYEEATNSFISISNQYTTRIFYDNVPSPNCKTASSLNQVFQENFEKSIPDSWVSINSSQPKGDDGFQWLNESGGITRSRFSSSDNSTGSSISSWLISPVLPIYKGDVVKFWVKAYSQSNWADRMQVRYSLKNEEQTIQLPVENDAQNIGSFDRLLLEVNPKEKLNVFPTDWEEKTITFDHLPKGAQHNIRIAFRHLVTDSEKNGNGILIDNVRLFSISCQPVVPK